MPPLLSKEHRILEKGMMEFRPFGVDFDGNAIRDLSGVVIRACIEYLEDFVCRTHGPGRGKEVVDELVRLVNERIPDRAYQVTSEFLKNPWNGYSNEFSAFLTQFCSNLSEDSQFQFNMAKEKAISPVIQTLGRPFSVTQIYKMSQFFAKIYSNKSFNVEALKIAEGSAIMRLSFTEHAYRQWDPFRYACTEMWCSAVKGYFLAVPEKFHHLPERPRSRF